jgi:peroxiredoxin Q/BCP
MKLKQLPYLMAAAFLSFLTSLFGNPLKVGDKAPEVAAVTDSGENIKLSEVYSKQPYTLVYFYPKAETSGCTAQGCSLRDAYSVLKEKGVAILGVSLDTVEAQKAFKEHHQFQFTLISDPKKLVVSAFGVPTHSIPILGEIASRQAFLIKNGVIIWADYKASTKKQAEDVLKVLSEQKS